MINELITLDTQNLDFVETYFCTADAFKYSFFPIPFLNGTNLTQSYAKITTEVWLTNPKLYLHNP